MENLMSESFNILVIILQRAWMQWLPRVIGVRSTDGMLVNMVISCLVLGIQPPWVSLGPDPEICMCEV